MFQPNVHVRKAMLAALMAAVWLLALASEPARALQEPPAVKALLDLLRMEMRLEPKVGSIRTDGDVIVLEDILLAEVRKDGRTALNARMKEIRLTGAKPGEGGLMLYKQISGDDLVIEVLAENDEPPMRVVVPRMTFVEASLLPRAAVRTPQEEHAASQLLASAMDVPEVRMEIPGIRPIVWTGLKGTWKGDRRTGAGEMWADLGTLPLPLAELVKLEKDQQRAARQLESLHALGLEKLTLRGEMRSDGTWTPDQRLMSNFSIRYGAQEAGELTLRLKDFALPLELMRKSREMARDMSGNPSEEKQRMPRNKPGAPGMGAGNLLNDPELGMALRRLTVGGLELKWRDHGLVQRLLEWDARKAGLDVFELVAKRLEETRMALSRVLPPEMVATYTRELSRFLQEPKSFRISISGANGQPIALANAAMFLLMPQMMLNAVKVEVKANEEQ